MAPLALEASYYQVLDVPFDASEEDIRKIYRKTVLTLHPDRRQNSEALERFHQVQTAWRCLSDPTRRLLYDLRNFERSSLMDDGDEGGAQSKLLDLQKQQAAIDIANMQNSLEKVLRRETAKGGILIKKALYGNLRLREDKLTECVGGSPATRRTIKETDLQGPFVDVTLPVQFMVHQHTIVLQGGGANSKADLPGFYNPAPLDSELELELYVLYDFKSHLHEVIVGDHSMLSMPLRKHMLPPNSAPRGPFSSATVAMLLVSMAEPESKVETAKPIPEGPSSATSVRTSRPTPRKSVFEECAEMAFNRAVSTYRLASLRARNPEDATLREFAIAALCGSAAVVLLAEGAVQALEVARAKTTLSTCLEIAKPGGAARFPAAAASAVEGLPAAAGSTASAAGVAAASATAVAVVATTGVVARYSRDWEKLLPPARVRHAVLFKMGECVFCARRKTGRLVSFARHAWRNSRLTRTM